MLTSDVYGPVLVRRLFGYVFIVPLEGWDNLSEPQRQSVMRHELAHYRRADVWTSLAARLVVLIHWFNPLAYFSLQRFEEAAEWACDEAALGKDGESTAIFAEALMSLNVSRTQILYGHGVFGRNISHRVARILNFSNTLKHKESMMKKAFLFTVVVLFSARCTIPQRAGDGAVLRAVAGWYNQHVRGLRSTFVPGSFGDRR
jgi:beta-lactamase regulating signal transducer with metallopeptidase domain